MNGNANRSFSLDIIDLVVYMHRFFFLFFYKGILLKPETYKITNKRKSVSTHTCIIIIASWYISEEHIELQANYLTESLASHGVSIYSRTGVILLQSGFERVSKEK